MSESSFKAMQYADAAEVAVKAINARVKTAWVDAGDEERDGKSLMMATFSVNSPVVLLGDTSGITSRDSQEGYMQLFAGAIRATRNPKAHELVTTVTPERACQLPVFASLLMQRLGEVEVR